MRGVDGTLTWFNGEMKWSLVAGIASLACSSQSSRPAAGTAKWAIALGGAGHDRALGTAIDSTGDVIAGVLSSGPSARMTKRAASDGSERWTISFAASAAGSLVELRGLAIAHDDSVLVTGDYAGTIDFGGQTLSFNGATPFTGDMFVAKYSAAGRLIWVKGLSTTADARGFAIASDDLGQIFVAGMFDGPLDLAGQQLTPTNNNDDCFIAAFDSSGRLLGGSAILGTGNDTNVTPSGAAISPTGDVLVTGSFWGPLTLGATTLSPDAADRAFLARFASNGQPRSIEALGASMPGESYSTQVVGGSAETVVQTIESDAAGAPNAYGRIYAFDESGVPTWSARIDDDGSSNPQFRTLAIGPDGVVVSAAWVDTPDTTDGSMEVAAFDASGARTTRSFGKRMVGAAVATGARASAFGPDGSSAFIGDFAGTLDFGGGPMVSSRSDDTDVFLVLVDAPLPQ